jgi:molybdenum cofactor cytidylyltransferase
MLAAVILAAGESRRMGFPKALLPFQGGTFLEHLIEVSCHPKIFWLRVVVGAHQEQIQQRVKLASSDWVVNPEWRKGQLSSIRAAIESLEGVNAQGIVVLLVDHPFVTKPILDALIEAYDRSPASIVIPTWRNRRGHPVLFPSHLLSELRAASDEVGARAVVWAHAAEVIEVPMQDESVLLDIDDRSTFEKLFPDGATDSNLPG